MLSHSKKLMEARLGVYEKAPFQMPGATEGIEHQSTLLRAEGGHRQQERMIQAKRKSFDRALFNSYQAAEISAVANPKERIRALINPNVTKQDYDDKILSVGYEYNLKPGDVFQWLGTKTHWLIYLQDLTELAYFKGNIRKCNYQVRWENEEGKLCSTWFAVRGPVETSLSSAQKNGVSFDFPNHSLNILMPKNEDTLKYFQRYAKFYITGADEITSTVCWRVEAIDTISMPGVLEINAVEYYANEQEDDIENGIVGGLIVEPAEPDNIEFIVGKTFIKPKATYLYEYIGNENGQWYVDARYPVALVQKSATAVEVTWLKTYSGEFELFYGNDSKKVVVESLF